MNRSATAQPQVGRFQDEWLARVVQARGLASAEAVARLRAERQAHLSEALLRARLVTEAQLGQAVADAYGVALVSPRREDIDRLTARLVPEALCRGRQLLPLRVKDETVEVAMANPLDAEALADVRGMSGREPAPLWCLPSALSSLIDAVYDPDGAVFDLLEKVGGEGDCVEVKPSRLEPDADASDVRMPVVRLVNMILANAVRHRASDVHIEHEETVSLVRLRVDGVLRPMISMPRRLAAGPLLARIKIMADLDIADRLRPQDGRAELRVGGNDIGLRVSTLPTQFGEKAVIRLLDRRAAQIPLDSLGFHPAQAARLADLAKAREGLIIVTGPTGSGKTTTLYSLLNVMRGEGINIVTIEDPVEYRLPGINQVQVHEKQGLGFAEALRSVLRQDPDVILVGEMRDAETARIAVQAAMTGHLVLTTLHANDAVAALTRLADMGVERYKLASALTAVTAQRLARRLCRVCRRPDPGTPYFRSGGCVDCGNTGARGRLALLELFAPDAELRARIAAGTGEEELRREGARRGALHEMAADVLSHLTDGDISREEALPFLSPGKDEEAPLVLVAEDEPSTRALLAAALRAEGYRVAEAADGEQALAQAREGVSLLLTDLHMPVLDGRGLISRLRARAAGAAVPVIVLTSDGDERSQQEALETGADDYVLKPVRPALLAARVKAALRRTGRVLAPGRGEGSAASPAG